VCVFANDRVNEKWIVGCRSVHVKRPSNRRKERTGPLINKLQLQLFRWQIKLGVVQCSFIATNILVLRTFAKSLYCLTWRLGLFSLIIFMNCWIITVIWELQCCFYQCSNCVESTNFLSDKNGNEESQNPLSFYF
jgi:hypothetical protein